MDCIFICLSFSLAKMIVLVLMMVGALTESEAVCMGLEMQLPEPVQ